MSQVEIRITAEPVDNHRCKFVVSQPLHAGVRRFASADEAKGSPLAEAIFAIPAGGVTEVIVSGTIVTVVKDNPAPWQAVGKAVGAAIRSAVAAGGQAVAPAPKPAHGAGAAVNDDALYEQVAKVFDEQVNPMVARHGGRVELIDVQDAVVMLRMGGGCQGCGMADVTLRQGIEGMLGQLVPEVRGIVDITDHTTGANPYFQASKK
jgi:NFU1 iron-sulfur cluster scaffold homolog, mitochondrial